MKSLKVKSKQNVKPKKLIMMGLGDLPGGSFASRANGVSGDGSVVVGRGVSASGAEAFIWDSTNGMVNLKTLLVDSGLDLTGWTLTSATGISADGLTICGTGNSPNGTEAWVATLDAPTPIPVPGSFLLGSMGISIVGWLRRRRTL